MIAGLGNPGDEYAPTRHNIGFGAVEALAEHRGLTFAPNRRLEAEIAQWSRPRGDWLVIKPTTFMNRSGDAVGAVMRYYKLRPESLVVVVDEVQLDLGQLKISQGGGDGGHNGTAHIIERIGREFVRLRLGVGPRQPPQIDLKDFVLGRFRNDERERFEQCKTRFVDALELLVDKGAAEAMNRLNRRSQENHSTHERNSDQAHIPGDLHPRHSGSGEAD